MFDRVVCSAYLRRPEDDSKEVSMSSSRRKERAEAYLRKTADGSDHFGSY